MIRRAEQIHNQITNTLARDNAVAVFLHGAFDTVSEGFDLIDCDWAFLTSDLKCFENFIAIKWFKAAIFFADLKLDFFFFFVCCKAGITFEAAATAADAVTLET
jgi:hypothetical protein